MTPATSPSREDFAASTRARRQSWGGAKKHVKRVLSWRVPNLAMRAAASVYPGELARHRLPAPASVRQVQASMAGVEFVMMRPDRCVVAKELYWGRGRRPQAADQTALDVFAALACDADLVLDIGAYTGIFSLLAARVAPTAAVHAFELIPAAAVMAVQNVVANDLITRVHVHLEGVGADGQTITVPTGDGGSALPDFMSSGLHFEHGVSVGLVSLDTVLQRLSEPPSRVVMKIDVEGAESAVLAGATRLLADTRPDMLCEILPDADTDSVAARLRPHGYRTLLVVEHGLVARNRLTADPRHRDWVFTTRSDEDLRALGIGVR